jgi:hypothetical protein
MGGLMSTIKANDLTNTTGGIPTVKSQQLIPTAWINFNGTGTPAIRDSENVSSITDNYTGNWTVNFSTTMANANFATLLNHGSSGYRGFNIIESTSTSGTRVETRGEAGGEVDATNISVLVMGGQS